LDLLFNFTSEKKSIEKFENIKETLLITSNELLNKRKIYYKIINNEKNKDVINDINIIIQEQIIIIKDLVNNYKNKNEDTVDIRGQLTEIAESYIFLNNKLKELRYAKYGDEPYIEGLIFTKKKENDELKNISRLVQNSYNINDLYLEV